MHKELLGVKIFAIIQMLAYFSIFAGAPFPSIILVTIFAYLPFAFVIVFFIGLLTLKQKLKWNNIFFTCVLVFSIGFYMLMTVGRQMTFGHEGFDLSVFSKEYYFILFALGIGLLIRSKLAMICSVVFAPYKLAMNFIIFIYLPIIEVSFGAALESAFPDILIFNLIEKGIIILFYAIYLVYFARPKVREYFGFR